MSDNSIHHNTGAIHVIGLGVSEYAQLNHDTIRALKTSHWIFGSERQLHIIRKIFDNTDTPNESNDELLPKQVVLPKLSELRVFIDQNSDKIISVLASGDPLYYGIGRWINQHYNHQQQPKSLLPCYFYPAVSSIQVACHRLGLSLQDIKVISLHGRPIEKLRRVLTNNTDILVLTDKYSHPQALAEECARAQLENSLLTVCEDLGYKGEKISQYTVRELLDKNPLSFSTLHITLIQTAGFGCVIPEFPGIPDHHYITGEIPGKGMITKREVRLSILSLMQTAAADVIWDIGAGCGGLAVELAYWNDRANIYAIECHDQRFRYLSANQRRFGVVNNLHLVHDRAPECLMELPKPNKIFIGGSDGKLHDLLKYAWSVLPNGGILMATSVIQESREILLSFAKKLQPSQVESVEISVKRAYLQKKDDEKDMHYTHKLPVEIFKFVKGELI